MEVLDTSDPVSSDSGTHAHPDVIMISVMNHKNVVVKKACAVGHFGLSQ